MEKETKKPAARFSIQVGWKGVVGGWLLGLLVLAWIFVLGVLVGRGDIPNPLEIPFLKKAPVNVSSQTPSATELENSKNEPQEQQPQPQLDFYKDLNKEGAEVRGVMPKKPVNEKTPEELMENVPQKAEDKKPNESGAVLTGEGQMTVPEKAEDKKPLSKFYTVQLGSFKAEAQARQFMEQMRKKEISCQLSAVNSNGMTWYRVRTGHFEDRANAQVFILSLKEKHRLNPMLIALP
jgi:cell division protein FtsN